MLVGKPDASEGWKRARSGDKSIWNAYEDLQITQLEVNGKLNGSLLERAERHLMQPNVIGKLIGWIARRASETR